MKKRTHIPVEPLEKQNFKKKFLERKMQDQDAEQQIRQFSREPTGPSMPETPSMEAKREM